MRFARIHGWLLLVAFSLAAGCEPAFDGEPSASRGELGAADESTAGEPTPGASAADERIPTPSDAPDPSPSALVLDQRADGTRLVGHPEPALPRADPERVVSLRVLRDGEPVAGEVDAALDGARVLDARFVGDAILTLGADHVMRVHQGGAATDLDTGAYGPLSVVGSRVAYARGEAPSLELARADLATLEAHVLTQGMAPVWSPALTSDGRAIVFVSGVDGSPRLYRVDGAGPPRALPAVGRFPTDPSPPRFEDGLYVFRDHLGTAWVDLEAGRIVRTAGGPR